MNKIQNIISLAGAVILKDGAILLLHRKTRDCYELPGRKIDDNETPETAAMREVKEELLVDIEIIKKLGTMDYEAIWHSSGQIHVA
jgi:ADP-ribose pyrophosphatase YjhB (NUDIX family)